MSSHQKARMRSLFLNSLNTNECIRQIRRFWYSLFARICILSATRRCYIHGDGNVNRAEKGISFFAIQHSSSRHSSFLTTLDWHFLSCDFRLQIVLALYFSLTKRRINGNTFVKHHRDRLFTHGRLYRFAAR